MNTPIDPNPIGYVYMSYGILKKFNNEVKSRKSIWDNMTPIQQYYAMMSYKKKVAGNINKKFNIRSKIKFFLLNE